MKNLFKRISALVMTAIMVLTMCATVFAAEETTKPTATITVNNAGTATLKYAQVIKVSTTTETGWDFVNDTVALAYIQAYDVAQTYSADNAQAAIKKLIANESATNLGKAQAVAAGNVSFVPMSNPQTVDKAGVYLIKADEVGYTYNLMSAYVGFGEVPKLANAEVDAKKTPIRVIKTVDEAPDAVKDNVTKTGDILTYTVETNVPYINPEDTDRSFWAYDELTGAEYYETNTATITLNGIDVTDTYPITFDTENNKFSVNLEKMIDNANSHAGEAVVITYKVKVTSENDTITNTATAGHKDGSEYGSQEIKTYEGNITLTKKNTEGENLANAGFEVRKDGSDDALTFVELRDGVYKYDPEGTITEVVTNASGTVKVQGLDAGKYLFKEITAPEGYHLTTTDAEANLVVGDEDGMASAVLTDETEMIDSKLGELPSTGGMGTYLFTIVGVVLMACAAGAFFISRRKTEE